MENKEKLKIVHFAHWSRSGITSLIKTIIANCNGSFSFVLLENDNNFHEFYKEIPKKTELRFSNSTFMAIKKYISFIKNEMPDVIHIHSLTPLLIATIFSPSYKKIFHLHCDYPYLVNRDFKSILKRQILIRCIERKNCKTVSVSETSKKLLEGISKVEVFYIANGVPDAGRIRSDFHTQKKSNRFYSVCRLDKEKNIIQTVNLIDALIKSGLDVYYDIYGSGSEHKNIEKHINAIGAQERIQMKGFSSTPEDLPYDYDFYISNSTQEGLSLSALHALRGKTPLITTPVGQIGLIIKDSLDGFLLQGDEQSKTKKLESILFLSDENLQKIQIRGRELFLDTYTIEKFLLSIEKLYAPLHMGDKN